MGQDFGYEKVDHNQVLVNRGDLQIILVTMAGLEQLLDDVAKPFNTAIDVLDIRKIVTMAGLEFLIDCTELGDEKALEQQIESATRMLQAAFK